MEGFIDWVVGTICELDITQHVVNNFSVDVQGDAAVAETYMASHARGTGDDDEPFNRITCVRFLDRVERRNGGPWLIADRIVVFDWLARWNTAAFEPAGRAGSNRPDDPSDGFLASWRQETGSTTAWLGP